jgi:hypothetical protein
VSSESRTLTPSIAECREELRAVLACRVFQQSQRLARLLQYICGKAVLGEADQVTEYTIAVDVFGKPQGFRESKDSVVRVEVHRLRKRLTAFYAQEGAGHRLRIVIPSGSYAPDFQVYQAPDSGPPLPEEPRIAEPGAMAVYPVSNGSAALPAEPETEAETDARALPRPDPKPGWSPLFLAAVVAMGLVTIAGAVWLVRSQRRTEQGANAPRVNTPGAPAVNTEVHILAGFSGNAWMDASGQLWQPDAYYKGGVSRPGPKNPGTAPPDRRLYQTMREGAGSSELPEDRQAFSYDIPMRPGAYELRLYFADPLKESPLLKDGEDGEDVRHFMVSVNGRPLLEQFDAVADAGYAGVDVRAFKDITPAADGKVHLEFMPNPHRPFVNALELAPSRAGRANPIRISARRSSYTDADGKTWGPDSYFIRGRLIRHTLPEAARDLPELFRAERYGNFSYSIPVPPGSYTLTLYFAETIFSPLAPSSICRGQGCRVFEVSCNGVDLLHDFDVFRAAGGAFRPVVRSFHGLRPNGQGKLLVSFTSSVNYAEVRALEVVDEAP